MIHLVADRLDPETRAVTKRDEFHAQTVVCFPGAATGTDPHRVSLSNPNIMLPVGGKAPDYQRVRVYGPDEKFIEALVYRAPIVAHVTDMDPGWGSD